MDDKKVSERTKLLRWHEIKKKRMEHLDKLLNAINECNVVKVEIKETA